MLDAQHRLLTSTCQLDMCAGLNRAQTHTSSKFGVIINSRIRITGNWATGPEKRQCLFHSRHFSGCCWSEFWHLKKSRMSLGGDDRTKKKTTVLPRGDRAITPHPATVSPLTWRVPVSIDGPSLEVIASVTCCGTNVGEMRISGLGLRQAEVETRDSRHMPCFLMCVSVGRGDGSHEADSPFQAVPKISSSAVLMMSINKGVNETHYHESILEPSEEHLGDQVMEKMLSPWKHSSLLPNKSKHIAWERAFVVLGERVWFIRTSNSARLSITFAVKSLSRTWPVAKDAQENNSKSRTRSTRRKFHVRQNVRNSITTDGSPDLGGPQGDWSSKMLRM